MKHKTTLYLDEKDLKELKRLTVSQPNETMTSLIKKAIRRYIIEIQKKTNDFKGFNKCKHSVKKNYFGESVKLQRQLRDNWE